MKMLKSLCILIVVFFKPPHVYSTEIDSLIQVVASAKEDTTRVDLLNQIASDYSETNVDIAMIYAKKSLALGQKILYQEGIAEAYRIMGKIYSFFGNYNLSMQYYDKSLHINKNIRCIPGIIRSYNGVGYNYRLQGNNIKALEYFFEGLKLSDESYYKEYTPHLLLNIGIAYELQENYKEALTYVFKAIKAGEDFGDKRVLIFAYNAVAEIYTLTGQPDLSLEYLQKGYKISKEINNLYTLGFISRYIGNFYMGRGEYATAYQYYKEGLESLDKIKNKGEIARLYNSMSLYYFAVKNYRQSMIYAKKALEMGEGLRSIELKNEAAAQVSKIYESINDYKNALQYYKLSGEMRDSLLSRQSIRKITEQAMQYDFNKIQRVQEIRQELELKRQKIVRNVFIVGFILVLVLAFFIYRSYQIKKKSNTLLLLKNEEIRQQKGEMEAQRDKLQELNQMRDKFFTIISHDLKSPFNALLGFSELINKKFDQLSKEKIKSFNLHIYEATKRLYDLIDNLIHWSKTKTNNVTVITRKIDVNEMVLDIFVLLKLNAKNKKVALISEVAENTFVTADNNLLSFILRNLIVNAIKFTKPGGRIIISSKENKKNLEISVKDNGVGIRPKDLHKLFREDIHYSTRGTENEGGSGLGLILCKEFVEKQGGTIKVNSEPGKGTTFSFTLPKANTPG